MPKMILVMPVSMRASKRLVPVTDRMLLVNLTPTPVRAMTEIMIWAQAQMAAMIAAWRAPVRMAFWYLGPHGFEVDAPVGVEKGQAQGGEQRPKGRILGRVALQQPVGQHDKGDQKENAGFDRGPPARDLVFVHAGVADLAGVKMDAHAHRREVKQGE